LKKSFDVATLTFISAGTDQGHTISSFWRQTISDRYNWQSPSWIWL